MTTRNKNIPALRFKGFSGNWSSVLLDDLADRGSGHTPSKSYPEYYNGSIKWVSLADSKKLDNGYIYDTEIKISEAGIKNSSAVLHPKDSVVLSRDAGIGKSAVMKVEMAVSQHFIVWHGKKNVLSNWFLYNILQILKPEFERIAIGSTIKTIGLPYFKKLKINIPTFPEQQKIASFLSAIDEKIRQLTRRKTLLEQYKKGVMQQLFSGKLRFKDEQGKAYAKWEEKGFGDVFEITSSKRVFQDEWTTFGVPFYRAREIVKLCNDGFVENELFISEEMFTSYQSKYGAPRENDILVTGVGTLGKTYIVKAKDRFYFKDGNIIWFKSSRIVNSKYINQLFQTKIIMEQISNNASITTVGTYTIDSAKKTKFPCPSIEEQNKIASFLSSLDAKIESVSAQIERTQGFKKGLLQKMFV